MRNNKNKVSIPLAKKQIMRKLLFLLLITAGCISCNNETATTETSPALPVLIKEDTIHYAGDSASMIGYVAYDGNTSVKRPLVIVLPEWWGITEYPMKRARMLANLGYFALVADLYGDGRTAADPQEAMALSGTFYTHPEKALARFEAARKRVEEFAEVDTSREAIIGYCFGGGMALNIGKLGEDVKGIVSFHGNLAGVPADKEKLRAPLLVCHGADDKFVGKDEVTQFRKQMDSIGADYEFISYPGAGHAFTNPQATDLGKAFKLPIAYNAKADTASWEAMQAFFNKIFSKTQAE
jgi:dienelactone hydrolase